MFVFLLCLMDVGNLISYVPVRTFANHADMATVARGLGISPWWIAVTLGIPFCLFATYFLIDVLPQSMRVFYPESRMRQGLLLALSLGTTFLFYGAAGFSGYGPTSHAISVTLIFVMLPLTAFYDWRKSGRSGV